MFLSRMWTRIFRQRAVARWPMSVPLGDQKKDEENRWDIGMFQGVKVLFGANFYRIFGEVEQDGHFWVMVVRSSWW